MKPDREPAPGQPVAAGRELVGTLVLALIQQWRLGRTRVGTEHLFLAMAERMPSLRMVRAGVSDRIRESATGWRSADAGADFPLVKDACEVEGALREAVWGARVRLRRDWDAPAPQWSGGVRAAVGRALLEAARGRARWAHSGHLLVGICLGEHDRAVEALRDLRFDPDAIVQQSPRVIGIEGTALTAGADLLEQTGALVAPPVGAARRVAVRLLTVLMRANATRYRLASYCPLVMAVDREAARQGIRLGAVQVTQSHLLLALLVLHEQLAQASQRLRPRWAAHNDAGELLHAAGVRQAALADRVARDPAPDQPLPPRSRPWRNRNSADPPFGRSVAEADRRAHALAAELNHRYAGTSHLLMALLEDPAGPPRSVLRGLGVDVDWLVGRVAQRLGLGGG